MDYQHWSTVDYLIAVLSPDGYILCHIIIINCGTSLWCAFAWWIYHVPWIIRCHLCHGVSAVVCSWIICCSVFMDYLVATILTVCFPLMNLPCPMDYQLSSVPWSICCSVFMDYLLSTILTIEDLTIRKLHLHQVRHQVYMTYGTT